MSACDDLQGLPGLKLQDGEPVFSEPWEAEAFALVVHLHEKGLFSWNEWASVLGGHLKQDQEHRAYYEIWLDALEDVLLTRSVCSTAELNTRSQAWTDALANTPHGEPVTLDTTATE